MEVPPTSQKSTHDVPAGTRPARIDAYLAAIGLVPSRAQAQRVVESGLVTLNGLPAKPSAKVRGGDRIDAAIPTPEPLALTAEDIPLPIVFEDDHLAVIDKPAGMVTHPAPGNWTGTLVQALLHHLQGLSGIGGRERPGIVHRLDKDTSGLMVVAKSDRAHHALSAAFKAHNLDRRYQALVAGHPDPDHGTIELAIGRDRGNRKKVSVSTDCPRHAVTHYRTLARYDLPGAGTVALVECKLETGRTHQIRVHLASRGWPVLGDSTYGGRRAWPRGFTVPRQMLHAARLHITHPITGEALKFDAPLPADFKDLLTQFEKAAK
ncbi:MAG: RluA family pseudouridine synthase [Nitrospirae bacterium]|nr:RluA family pseudouridine synthase [Nitrospirota bacterium]